MRRFVVVVLAAVTVAASSASAQEPTETVAYRPPVEAPLTDTFRPPATDYGPGNRGVDYATIEGQSVTAAAAGEVTFAGAVGNDVHVVVLHADGIRTSYSFLAAADVRRGDKVEQGQRVGSAKAAGLHFGARAGDDYVDPLLLLGLVAGERRAFLVDDDESKPLDEVVERRWLIEALRTGGRAVDWAVAQAEAKFRSKLAMATAVVDSATDLWIPVPVYLAVSAVQWERDQRTCTPETTPVPTPAEIGNGRIVVLVGGLLSSTGNADVLKVDTQALGYRPDDVHQFSYRDDGGRYVAEDTLGDLDGAGALLARRIGDLQRRHPGRRVDVIAHSQGGLVARSAVTRHGAKPATLVTLATPHDGTELATMAVGVDGTRSGHLLLEAVGSQRPGGLDLNATSVLQMAEGSPFIVDLRRNGRWPPADVTHAVSIGAHGDPIVPSRHAHLPGALNTVVTPFGTPSFGNHGRLPGSPEAAREIARALVRQGPTCRSLRQTLADDLASVRLSDAQDGAVLASAAAFVYLDKRTKLPPERAAIAKAKEMGGRLVRR